MSKRAAVVVVMSVPLLFFWLVLSGSSSGHPPELSQVTTSFNEIKSELNQQQTTYHINNGGYYQGIDTHSAPPMWNIPTPPDQLGAKPTDQQHNWFDFYTMPVSMTYSLSIDIYDGPFGEGYVYNLTTTYSTTVYIKRINYGPEVWRGREWEEK